MNQIFALKYLICDLRVGHRHPATRLQSHGRLQLLRLLIEREALMVRHYYRVCVALTGRG